VSHLLPILTFHGLDRGKSNISFSPALFRDGITRLHTGNYCTLALSEVSSCIVNGRPFPDRSIVITFDDGYRSVYDEAFPVLKKHGLSAVVFLRIGNKARCVKGRLPSYESRAMLSWDEIREMHQAGIGFGAHTLTHPDLTRVSFEEAKREVLESKTIIEDVLNERVRCFAYPYGRFNEGIKNLIQDHFECACSDRLDFVTNRSDPFDLERIDAYYLRKEWMFNMFFGGVFRWYIKSCSIPRQIRRFFQPSPPS
jgi:peptidoglycan/xylan/chitin deacetylase (PgdA/CDA1 family)